MKVLDDKNIVSNVEAAQGLSLFLFFVGKKNIVNMVPVLFSFNLIFEFLVEKK